MRLCPECTRKLHYKKNKEGKRKREEVEDTLDTSPPSKKKQQQAEEAGASSSSGAQQGSEASSSKAWSKPIESSESEPKEEEDIDSFLKEMGLLM